MVKKTYKEVFNTVKNETYPTVEDYVEVVERIMRTSGWTREEFSRELLINPFGEE